MPHEAELRKFVAPEFVFGHGARDLVGRYARNYGARKVLVVTDPGVITAGWTDQVTTNLTAAAVPYVIFSQVRPNPRAEEVMAGAELYAASGCDVIVAVGGGSPMDCAKGIGIVSTNRRNILEFEGVDQVPSPAPPLICVPTTGGTSADVSQFAIIANRPAQVKIAIISKTVVPDVALIDPATLTSMPPYLAACTGIDALVHAIEAFVSNAHSPMTDLHALEAIRLISTSLGQMLTTPTDTDAVSRVMLGSLHAGLAFSNASLGAVHAMAHSLGGFLDLPHGECNALLLRHVMDFNLSEAVERYQPIAHALGLDLRGLTTTRQSQALLTEVDRLRGAVGIKRTLDQVGVHRSDLPILARKAIKDPCMVTNPRRPTIRDIEVIYEAAL